MERVPGRPRWPDRDEGWGEEPPPALHSSEHLKSPESVFFSFFSFLANALTKYKQLLEPALIFMRYKNIYGMSAARLGWGGGDQNGEACR